MRPGVSQRILPALCYPREGLPVRPRIMHGEEEDPGGHAAREEDSQQVQSGTVRCGVVGLGVRLDSRPIATTKRLVAYQVDLGGRCIHGRLLPVHSQKRGPHDGRETGGLDGQPPRG